VKAGNRRASIVFDETDEFYKETKDNDDCIDDDDTDDDDSDDDDNDDDDNDDKDDSNDNDNDNDDDDDDDGDDREKRRIRMEVVTSTCKLLSRQHREGRVRSCARRIYDCSRKHVPSSSSSYPHCYRCRCQTCCPPPFAQRRSRVC